MRVMSTEKIANFSEPSQFDPETLHGISFYDAATESQMRYIYSDAGHWSAGWIVRKTRGGQWETYRKATDQDIASLFCVGEI